jgi:hypothetical protein
MDVRNVYILGENRKTTFEMVERSIILKCKFRGLPDGGRSVTPIGFIKAEK